MKKQQNLRFSRDMATVRICVFLLLFLSQTWAETEELQMVDMKQDVRQDNGEINITVNVWEELKELRDMVIDQKFDLSNSKSKIEKLEEQKSVLDARLSASESEVAELKRQITETPKVAFSLGLSDAGHIGPFNTDITLKFTKVLTNYGQAYNTHTGVFTAPFRGVYFFRYTGFVAASHQSIAIDLYHNDKRVSRNFDINDTRYDLVSNGFVLEMEKGDVVYLVLPSGYGVYDSSDNYTVFSGFLIFPL